MTPSGESRVRKLLITAGMLDAGFDLPTALFVTRLPTESLRIKRLRSAWESIGNRVAGGVCSSLKDLYSKTAERGNKLRGFDLKTRSTMRAVASSKREPRKHARDYMAISADNSGPSAAKT